jgi:hypothetical protein
MKKSTTAMGLALAAATIGAALWALDPSDASAPSSVAELAAPAHEPVREERTLAVPATPREAKAPAGAKAKEYIPATDYARPEDVPWEVFQNKKHALKLRPNRILEDGTIEYVDVPMIQKGKRVFGTMSAKPTEIAPVLPEEVPEGLGDSEGSAATQPVGIPNAGGLPTPGGATPPPPLPQKRN